RAAEKHGLPIGIHAGSALLHPPSATGWFSYYMEDYVQQAQGFAGTLSSLLTEGVFVKFPKLKVVLIESGVTWLPAYLWRINKTWRGVRAETPWQERMPSEVIRENVRLTIQPFDAPDTIANVETVLEEIGSDTMLLFSSDYPHRHFDGTDAVPDGLPPDLIRKILVDNPLETYPRLT
ncbi:MAG TPA: amidohydrolase family protein, partial [Acetobacteraceae bacterium]|nr:amidohydrolase family protein [Acetobacteraceae bacterium]